MTSGEAVDRLAIIKQKEKAVAELDKRVAACEEAVEAAKANLKAAEADWLGAVNELREAITGKGQSDLPFEAKKEEPHAAAAPRKKVDVVDVPHTAKDATAPAAPKPETPALPALTAPPPVKEPEQKPTAGTGSRGMLEANWREVRLSTLGLNARGLAALDEAGFKTVGDLADWTSQGKLLGDIKGVGPGTARIIEVAMEDLWAERKRAGLADGEPPIKKPDVPNAVAAQIENEKADPAPEQSGDDSTVFLEVGKRYKVRHVSRAGELVATVLLFDDTNVTFRVEDPGTVKGPEKGKTLTMKRADLIMSPTPF